MPPLSPNGLPKNLSRAIDLSSLAAPKSGVKSDVIPAVTGANLVSTYLEASNRQVVILLCWSPRSAQSQQVADSLAKFHAQDSAKSGGAAWVLGAVNVDAEPAVAQALQVQSVPLALAIIQEQVVPLFESVPTEAQIRLVIDKVLSLAAERGLAAPADDGSGEPPVEPQEPEEIAAMDALEAGDFLAAKAAYEAWLRRSPFDPLAKLGLAQTELFIRTQGIDIAHAIQRATLEPENLEAAMLAADLELLHGQPQSAFNRLIAVIRNTTGDDRKKVQERLLELFSLVDPADPILVKARQALASALF